MNDPRPISRPALYSVAALGFLGLLGGWLTLLSGGFHHQVHRHTSETTFVTGLPALLMAALMFGLAALGALVLVRARNASFFCQVLVCGAVLVPPGLFIVIA